MTELNRPDLSPLESLKAAAPAKVDAPASEQAATPEALFDLELAKITFRKNLRDVSGSQTLQDLVANIRLHGIQEPLVVRESSMGRYELVAGERQARAARLAGLRSVPAILRGAEDAQSNLLQVAENIHRENLSRLEEARMLHAMLLEYGTLETVARRVNKSKPWVSERLQLLDLSAPASALIADDVTADLDVINAVNRAARVDLVAATALAVEVRSAEKKRVAARLGLLRIKRNRPSPPQSAQRDAGAHRDAARLAGELARLGDPNRPLAERARAVRSVVARSPHSGCEALKAVMREAHQVGTRLRAAGAGGLPAGVGDLGQLFADQSAASGWHKMILRAYTVGLLGDPYDFEHIAVG